MTATAHALIGASLAVKIINPIFGIPLAILSHFIADLVPHWDAGTNHKQKSLARPLVDALSRREREGMVEVPREPTEEMIAYGKSAFTHESRYSLRRAIVMAWTAMLAAAPPAGEGK